MDAIHTPLGRSPHWMGPMAKSILFDAVASVLFIMLADLLGKTNLYWILPVLALVAWAPTGYYFLRSLEAREKSYIRHNVGIAYVVFGTGAAILNGIGGLLIGQVPTNWMLGVLGVLFGVTSIVIGAMSRGGGTEKEPDLGLEVGLIYIPVFVAILVAVVTKWWVAWLIAYPLADVGGTFLAYRLKQFSEKRLQKKYHPNATKIIFWTSFIPTSAVFGGLLLTSHGLLFASLAAGISSIILAPILELVLLGRKGFDARNTLGTIAFGVTAVILVKLSFPTW